MAVSSSQDGGAFESISYVNSICTSQGGEHVKAVTEMITKALVPHVIKKTKVKTVKPGQVKNHLWVFVNCLIVNPRFNSQTKVQLTSTKAQFGSKWIMEDKFIAGSIAAASFSFSHIPRPPPPFYHFILVGRLEWSI